MRIDRDRIVKLGAFLSRDGAMSATRVLVGVALGAVIGANAGIPALIAVGLGIVGVNALAHRSIEKQRQSELLDLYREEISHITGKNVKALTIADLKEASVKEHAGGHGSKALQMALEYFADTRNFYVTSQAVTAGLMGTALYALNANFGVSALGLASASGLLYNELFNSVRHIGELFTDRNIKGTITHDIKEISKQIAEGGRLSSTRVMGIIVEANPKLGSAIQQEYGQAYDELSIADKRHVVDKFGPFVGVVDITQKINQGVMLPTELAFVAFGESSGTPLRPVVPEMHPVVKQPEMKTWADRIHLAATKIAPRATSHVAEMEAQEIGAEATPTLH